MSTSAIGKGSLVKKLPSGKWLGDIDISSMYANIITNKSMVKWTARYDFGPDDKVIRTDDGHYSVNASNIIEKIDWLTEVFGMGSNNPKSQWRVKWRHMNTYRTFPEASGVIWMKPDVALQYKLRWSGE